MSLRWSTGAARLLSLFLGAGLLACSDDGEEIGDAVDGLATDRGVDPDVSVDLAPEAGDAGDDADDGDESRDVPDLLGGDTSDMGDVPGDAAPDLVGDVADAAAEMTPDAAPDADGGDPAPDVAPDVAGDTDLGAVDLTADLDAGDLGPDGDVADTAADVPVDPAPGDAADAAADGILYSQRDALSGAVFLCSDFPFTDDADVEIADDFVVPEPGWILEGLVVDGATTGDFVYTMSHVNVRLYGDGDGGPGELVDDWLEYEGFVNDGGDLTITLPRALSLTPGRYWVSVQAASTRDESVRWSCAGRGIIAGEAAQLRNPGNFWGFDCVSWGDAGICNGTDATDVGFALFGSLDVPD